MTKDARDFELDRLHVEIERLRAALKELADASEHDMHLNQGGDNHDDEPEGSGGWWSVRTFNAIGQARAALSPPVDGAAS